MLIFSNLEQVQRLDYFGQPYTAFRLTNRPQPTREQLWKEYRSRPRVVPQAGVVMDVKTQETLNDIHYNNLNGEL